MPPLCRVAAVKLTVERLTSILRRGAGNLRDHLMGRYLCSQQGSESGKFLPTGHANLHRVGVASETLAEGTSGDDALGRVGGRTCSAAPRTYWMMSVAGRGMTCFAAAPLTAVRLSSYWETGFGPAWIILISVGDSREGSQ